MNILFQTPMIAMFGIGPQEMIIVGIVAVLLFGKRLPEVARSLGKGVVEFKKGVAGIEDDLRSDNSRTASNRSRYSDIDDRDEATAPRFEPPKNEPQDRLET
jgi:sec-independent protein translocase protein TatA